jgi:hypothetical protein
MQIPLPNSGRKVAASVPAFDYAAMAPELANKLKKQAARIKKQMKATTAAIIEIGRDLIAVKQHLEHGQFGSWVESECGFTTRTARNYMRAAEFAEGKSETISDLSPTCLYLLATKSTPTEIAIEVIARVESGEIVSDDAVIAMLVEHKSHSEPPEEPEEPDETGVPEDEEGATAEELQRAGFLVCCAKAAAYASYHDLTNAVITPEMADAAQKAADAWTTRAQVLNTAVARGVTPASIVCEADTPAQREALDPANDDQPVTPGTIA